MFAFLSLKCQNKHKTLKKLWGSGTQIILMSWCYFLSFCGLCGEKRDKKYGRGIELANLWYLPQKYSFRDIEIRYHESSWKKITCGYNNQGKLKSLTLKNNMEEVLQIQKNSSQWSNNCTPGHISEKTLIWKDTFAPVFIEALFIIVKTWKQPKCPSTGKWVQMWYIHTMEYYSAIKTNEIMPFAAPWMDLAISY